MASSLVFFRTEIDFIAQKSFSVLAAHLWPFINTTAGGSEGTEGNQASTRLAFIPRGNYAD